MLIQLMKLTDGFSQKLQSECLPPTSDALRQHIKWAHYQTTVGEQAYSQGSLNPADPTMYSWQKGTKNSSLLIPVLTMIDVVPKECFDIVACKCKRDMCKSRACKCQIANMQCCRLCECHNHVTWNDHSFQNLLKHVRYVLQILPFMNILPWNPIFSIKIISGASIEHELK